LQARERVAIPARLTQRTRVAVANSAQAATPNDGDNARFWNQVEHGLEPDACWIWTGYCDSQGYGRLRFDGAWEYAHRVAWRLVHGEVEPGIQLMAQCRQRACVRTDHHLPKTAAEAGRYKAEHDLVARGERTRPETRARGERHGSAKLSDAQVAEIRRRYVPRVVTLQQLAAEYGVNHSVIWHVVKRKIRNG
jgi:HNH endonuclease